MLLGSIWESAALICMDYRKAYVFHNLLSKCFGKTKIFMHFFVTFHFISLTLLSVGLTNSCSKITNKYQLEQKNRKVA